MNKSVFNQLKTNASCLELLLKTIEVVPLICKGSLFQAIGA